MKRALTISLAFVLATMVSSGLSVASDSVEKSIGGIATLYALDAATSHLSLNDGMPGTVVQGHLSFNRDSQLSFDTYVKDGFRVGIQGGEDGAIVDLGDDRALKARYGYAETVGNAQGFASIHLEGGRAVIVKDYRTRAFQPLAEFDELGRERENGDTAAVALGHIYLVRITAASGDKMHAKLKVLAFVPGQYVTVRWARL
jgi:hypothetical protein